MPSDCQIPSDSHSLRQSPSGLFGVHNHPSLEDGLHSPSIWLLTRLVVPAMATGGRRCTAAVAAQSRMRTPTHRPAGRCWVAGSRQDSARSLEVRAPGPTSAKPEGWAVKLPLEGPLHASQSTQPPPFSKWRNWGSVTCPMCSVHCHATPPCVPWLV